MGIFTVIRRQGLCHVLGGCGLEEEGENGVQRPAVAASQGKRQLKLCLTSVGAGLLDSNVCG